MRRSDCSSWPSTPSAISVPQIDNSVQAVTALIARLKTALAEMQDLVKFHEAIAGCKP